MTGQIALQVMSDQYGAVPCGRGPLYREACRDDLNTIVARAAQALLS